jgi:formylmethanofuran dehydrogenase subunit B
VNFAAGYPRYHPGEFSAPEMLSRREVDACLFLGSETTSEFGPDARELLRQIPIIALESPMTESIPRPTVRFTTAVYGVHRRGTAYRMDEVPVPLQILLPTNYPSDGEVLQGVLDRLK